MFSVNKEKCIGCSQCVKDCPVSAISLVDKESRIRYYLDSKMIKYYSNFFAKKIRRSKDDFWRDERFDQMSILMQDVRDDLLKNMSHYQKKMVKLARNHDLQQTQKVIAKHLAKNKMKKILKNKVCNIQKEYAKRRNKEASRKNHTEGLSRRSKAIGKRTENPLWLHDFSLFSVYFIDIDPPKKGTYSVDIIIDCKK